MNFLALSILNLGVPLSMVCAVIGLVAAFLLIALVIRSPSGNERMREISAAVQEGAKYLDTSRREGLGLPGQSAWTARKRKRKATTARRG